MSLNYLRLEWPTFEDIGGFIMLVAIITRYIYGESGDERMPPSTRVQSVILSELRESDEEFRDKVQNYGMKLRNEANGAPVRPYSLRDGIDWSILKVIDRPIDF